MEVGFSPFAEPLVLRVPARWKIILRKNVPQTFLRSLDSSLTSGESAFQTAFELLRTDLRIPIADVQDIHIGDHLLARVGSASSILRTRSKVSEIKNRRYAGRLCYRFPVITSRDRPTCSGGR
jgi:hypothetical protein